MAERVPPPELLRVVNSSVAPGVSVSNPSWVFDTHAWHFHLRWRSLNFELVIGGESTSDRAWEYISLLAKLAAPFPDATLGGRMFSVAFQGKRTPGDYHTFPFVLFLDQSSDPRIVSVEIADPARALLDGLLRQAKSPHDSRAFALAYALWSLKDRLDANIENSAEKIFSDQITLERPQASFPAIRHYVRYKLYQMFQTVGKETPLQLDWTDHWYLGVDEDSLGRALSLEEGTTWEQGEGGLIPTVSFLREFEETGATKEAVVGIPNSVDSSTAEKVFIGHGHSQAWRELRDFLEDRLKLECDEFNREPTAGITTVARLDQMLVDARFAFIVMTAEDERTDGSLHPRDNVIHEAGLFQGRLGFARAIILLEEGCREFSNIHGLTQIRFPQNRISAAFEEIRRVLERERVLEP